MEAINLTLLAEVLRTAGIGGVLAITMFHFYRKDSKMWMTRHEEMMNRFETHMCDQRQIIIDNTTAMTMVAVRLDNIVGITFDEATERQRHQR